MKILGDAFSSAVLAATIMAGVMLIVRPEGLTIERILYWSGTAFAVVVIIGVLSKLWRSK